MKIRLICGIIFSLLCLTLSVEASKPAEGMPAFKAGDPEAFFIWHDINGWHLRVTTPKKKWHAFQGVVRALGNPITNVKATRPALASKLQTTNKAVFFDFEIFEGIDGFDWNTDERCMTIELRIDKLPQPSRIHVGAKGETPVAMPFDACK